MYYRGKKSLLKRRLGSLNLLLFGLGNIFGPQVFLMLGTLVVLAGVYGLISLLICSMICFLIAMVFSELTLSMPVAGLVINSINDTFGGFISFIIGWSQILGNVTFAAFCALGFGMFVGHPILGAITITFIVTLLEFVGISELGKIQNVIVGIILLFFVLVIATNFNMSNLTSISTLPLGFSNIKKIFLGIGFFFLAFTGFEDLSTYSEEVKNLSNLPKVMFSVILIVTLIFLFLYLVVISSAGNTLSNPLIFLSQKLFGDYSNFVVAVIGSAASIGSLMTTLSTISRNIFSMSEKGFLPKKLYKVSKSNTPTNAIIFASILTGIIIFIRQIHILAYLANFIYFLMVFFVTWSLIKLREKRKSLHRPFKIPLVLAIITLILLIALMFFLSLKSIALGFIWLFFGFIFYMLRIVGEHRIKMASIGGILLTSFIMVFLMVILQEVFPELFDFHLVIILFICFIVFLFYFSLATLLDVLQTRYTHKR